MYEYLSLDVSRQLYPLRSWTDPVNWSTLLYLTAITASRSTTSKYSPSTPLTPCYARWSNKIADPKDP